MPLQATLLVLAGGDSRRMGRPKALLPVGGTTLVEWLIAQLAPELAHLVVSARGPEQLPPGLRPHLVCDLAPGAGPLGGIQAGLRASPHDTVVAVACDMPAVTADLVRRLVRAVEPAPAAPGDPARAAPADAAPADAAVPRIGGRPEPTCAAYRRSSAGSITAAIEAGRLRAADALDGLRVRWLDGEDPRLFSNLNTPEDYRRFLEQLTPGGRRER